jgi:predicted nucleotidyltransferase
MAPMEFKILMDDVDLDGNTITAIEDLLGRKIIGEELDRAPQIKVINDLLAGEILHFENFVKGIDPNTMSNTEKLDLLFRKSLQEAWKEQ